MKKIIIFCFLIAFCNIAFCQKECGTKVPLEATYDESLRKMSIKKQNDLARGITINSIKYVRVKIYDFCNGTDSAWTKAQINTEFQLAKSLLAPYRICLVLEGVIYRQTTTLLDFEVNGSLSNLLGGLNSQPNAINCYLHKTLTLNGGGLNGYAYAISQNFLSLSRGALTQRSFAHEIAHCFGLIHVFETAYGLECPDGSNGSSAGDKIPSTKATPDADSYISNNTNTSCIYTGTIAINCNGANRVYNPEIDNIMCYGRRTCRSIFLFAQEDLMHYTSQDTYLLPTLLDYHGSAPITGNINIDDVKINEGILQIGNNAASINTNLGNTSLQRYISETQVKLTPGVRIVANTDRCRVVLKTTDLCYGVIN
jgi:hypothetical protein